jgi:four helix bundle protein
MDRATAKTFEDLIVWQKAHALVLGIYKASGMFPKIEVYGLTALIRRSAFSVPANIAEGFRKRSRLDKVRFLNIAQGSLEETRYYLILAQDLGYMPKGDLREELAEVSRLLDSYSRMILESIS